VNWNFVPVHLAVVWHERLIETFGGAAGLRDAGLLESALDRPRNLAAYDPDATLYRLAALYGVGLASAHAFIDGNKRIAFAVMVAFLKAHGQSLDTSEADAAAVMVAVASNNLDEDGLHAWLVERCRSA